MNKHRNTVNMPSADLTLPNNEMDEIENVTERQIGEKGDIAISTQMALGEPVFTDVRNDNIYKIRSFKRYAKEAIDTMLEITRLISQLL